MAGTGFCASFILGSKPNTYHSVLTQTTDELILGCTPGHGHEETWVPLRTH